MRAASAVALFAAIGAVIFWGIQRRQGETLPGEAPEGSPPALPGLLAQWFASLETQPAPVYDPRDAQARAGNRAAFLTMIAAAEGTDSAGDYRALFGSTPGALSLMDTYADHPALLGWPGVALSPELCAAAGFASGCVSTAAGRYQITRPTWRTLRDALSLADFSPASQDAAALELLARNGALALVDAGELERAIDQVRKVWASLPGAGYGQAEQSIGALRDVFISAGGVLA